MSHLFKVLGLSSVLTIGLYADYSNFLVPIETDLNQLQYENLCSLVATPPVPENVEATDGTSSSVEITFETSSCSSKYEIYRKRAEYSELLTLLGETTEGTFTDNTATFGQRYDYYVKAYNSVGSSSYSDPDEGYATNILLNICPFTAPDAPTTVIATDGTHSDKVVISSYSVSCAASYEIYRNGHLMAPKTLIASGVTDSSYDDTTATPGTMYYYYVKAVNTWGTSGYSAVESGFSLAAESGSSSSSGVSPGTIPSNPTATQGTHPDKVVLSWDTVIDADGYKIYRNTTGTGTFQQINWPQSSGTTYDDTNVEPGTIYYYIVKSTDGGVDSENSDVFSGYASGASAAYTPEVPTSVAASDGEYSDRVDIYFDAVDGATKYEIYRSEDSSVMGSKLGSISTNAASDTSVMPGTVYYYRIKACSGDECSDYSMPDTGYANAMEELTQEDIVTFYLALEETFTFNGTFGQHDFAESDTAFDWAYTVIGGGTYQLQGQEPSDLSVFGWKEVAIPTPTPAWYMFALGADVDGDGNQKFDWILVSASSTKAVYKLKGVTASGNFAYTDKLEIDYTISSDGKTVTFEQ